MYVAAFYVAAPKQTTHMSPHSTLYNGTLLSNKKEWADLRNNVNESHRRYAEEKTQGGYSICISQGPIRRLNPHSHLKGECLIYRIKHSAEH